MKSKDFNITGSFRVLSLLLTCLFLYTSCKKNDEGTAVSSGTPVITQIRLINPEKKDSTFTQANPGTQVLIEGQNLGGIKNIYFNDYEASFNSTYNTNDNVIVTIPTKAPTEATVPDVPNKIRIVTSHGEVIYDFVLSIPPPVVNRIVNENALPGEKLTILGSNLWLISKVTFPGNKEVTAVTSNADGSIVELTVPSDIGSASGDLTITAKYGTVVSKGYNLHEGAGVISNLTSGEGGEADVFNWAWWGANRTADKSMFPGTRGAYLQNIFGGVGAADGGWWNGNRSGNFTEVTLFSDAVLSESASNYALKFEINTKEPWTTGIQVLRFGDDYAYRNMPYATATDKIFDTKNKWETITIPLSAFRKAVNGVEGTGANAVTMANLVKAGGKVNFSYRFISEADPIVIFNAAFDNIRIVKIK
ncbi:MAG: hypothetical protein JWN56_2061 [Sphingobacteriales bacterium]|nr:hypothetical protein [Sphingobacteriales bacterium]